jgi:hypothetical protein
VGSYNFAGTKLLHGLSFQWKHDLKCGQSKKTVKFGLRFFCHLVHIDRNWHRNGDCQENVLLQRDLGDGFGSSGVMRSLHHPWNQLEPNQF